MGIRGHCVAHPRSGPCFLYAERITWWHQMTLSEIVLGYRLIAALGIRGLHQVQ